MNSASITPKATPKTDSPDGDVATSAKPPRRRAAKTPKAPKPAKAATRPRGSAKQAIPDLDELKLAPNGITSVGRRVDLKFTNGFSIGLLPVRCDKTDLSKVRDLVVAWLNKRP